MKQIFLSLAVFVVICSCGQQKQPQDDVPSADNGWLSLLNNDLAGWVTIGPVEANLTEGTLTLTASEDSSSAMFITEQSYDNFQLEFEFQSSENQSGIAFRFNDKLKTTTEQAGYLLSTNINPLQQNPVGTIIGTARSTVLESTDTQGWNSIRLEAAGSHLKVFLNDELVAEANDKRFSQGKIALRAPKSSGTPINFRNVRIQPLMMAAVVTELLEDRYRSDNTRSWETMFDGNTLNGWQPIGDGSWKVEDGAIHGYSGVEGGFLVSDNAYKNFYLKTEFKIIKEDNSGIFIRKTPDSAAVTITDAIECNIYDHNGPAHAYSTGSVATHARAWYGMIDYQDWNEMEIFTEEEHIVMYVNGRKSSESYLPSKFNKAGNICLQGGIKVFAEDKGPSDIYFKNIMVKSMD